MHSQADLDQATAREEHLILLLSAANREIGVLHALIHDLRESIRRLQADLVAAGQNHAADVRRLKAEKGRT